ncbi:hypothetical protein KFL_004120120 [Klebsormidium nitens]|uniref:AP complex subunit sigma n=1 Tax=Klebsormidium nitens TaxID=105231 RepID=A0A1Y1IBA2_KLENI|nr:hypothetical protein KFL_004120120 [Klebsormidium nitens]|eukprot:GAQ88245.1 hypothetical protein KFL_004120120 [Klebsormidium nitens]
MIKAVLIINNVGKPRLTKFYEPVVPEKQRELIRTTYSILSKRADNLCSFVEDESAFGKGTKVVYRHYATLYFVFIVDNTESELGILDLIQVFVETLDRVFQHVCELDLVHNFPRANAVLDEIVMGGQVLETNSADVVKALSDMQKLDRQPSVTTIRAPGALRS